MKAHQISASVFGIGYVRGGGTLAALATCLVCYLAQAGGVHPATWLPLAITVLVTAIGIWNGNVVEKAWGKDSSRVVIDEVAGQCVSLLFLPVFSWQTILASLLLFRFFDIAKPLGIRRTETFRGGWGVMMDDVLAGVYANLTLQVILHETTR